MRWAVYDDGRPVPLDPEPVECGLLVLVKLEIGVRPTVRHYQGESTGVAPRYMPHTTTCSKARPPTHGFHRRKAS